MRRPVGHMPTSVLERIIDQAEFFTEPAWLHWFGEPLMNPFLFEQIEIAKRKVPNLGISTNAALLRPRAQKSILESKLDTIIAIDGATKDVYEKVRKSERFTYEQVSENAEQFLSRRRDQGSKRPYVILSIIVMDLTSAEINDFVIIYWRAAPMRFCSSRTSIGADNTRMYSTTLKWWRSARYSLRLVLTHAS